VCRRRALQTLLHGAAPEEVRGQATDAFVQQLDFSIRDEPFALAVAAPPSLETLAPPAQRFLRTWQAEQARLGLAASAGDTEGSAAAELEHEQTAILRTSRSAAAPSSSAEFDSGAGLDGEMESEREQEQEKQQEVEKEVATMTGRERDADEAWSITDLNSPSGSLAQARVANGAFHPLNEFAPQSATGAGFATAPPLLACGGGIVLSENVASSHYIGEVPRRLKNIACMLQWRAGAERAPVSAAVSLAEAAALRRAMHADTWRGLSGGERSATPPMRLVMCGDGSELADAQGFSAMVAAAKDSEDSADAAYEAHRQVLRLFNCDLHFSWPQALVLLEDVAKTDPATRRRFLRATLGCRRRARLTTAGTMAEAVLREPDVGELQRLSNTSKELRAQLGGSARAAFKRADVSGDGMLSQSELNQAIGTVFRGVDGAALHKLAAYADNVLGDGDGKVAYHEFCDNILQLEPEAAVPGQRTFPSARVRPDHVALDVSPE
jgi:hypothetical protein